MQRNKKNSKKIIGGSKFKIGIIVSEFNNDITERLLKGAFETLEKNKVKKSNIKVIRVPGSFEIPLVCQKLAQTKKYNALIALGCVIKGDTDHYYYVAGGATYGLMNVVLKYSIPIGFGVLTTLNLKQAKERSAGKNNKGREVAETVLKILQNK